MSINQLEITKEQFNKLTSLPAVQDLSTLNEIGELNNQYKQWIKIAGIEFVVKDE